MVDTLLRVVTPEGISFDLHPAGPLPRLAAYLLDTFFQFLILIAMAFPAEAVGLTGPWIFSLLGFALMWFYMVFFEVLLGGRTPGKRIVGLQVVQRDGTPPTFGMSLLRNLLRFADFFAALGLLVPLLVPGFRRLGDLVAGTLVIYAPEQVSNRRGRNAFDSVSPTPPQRILDSDASLAVMEFARRMDRFGPGLRKELAELALPVYVLDPEHEKDAEPTLVSIAAWCAGVRR